MSIVGTAPRPNGNEEDHTGLLSLAASGLAVGALAGLVASAFHFALDAAERLLAALLAWAHGYPAVGWVAPVLLAAAAAFVARWLVRRYAPEAAGSGVQHVEAVIRGHAISMSAAVLPIKFVGGVLALGAGMALGREGPTVQIGATIGHLWSRLFKLRTGDGRALLAAGAGAGLAAATLSACSAGLVIMRMLIGDRLVFSVPAIVVEVFPGYLVFLVFGGVVGVLGALYSRMVVAGLDVADGLRRVPP